MTVPATLGWIDRSMSEPSLLRDLIRKAKGGDLHSFEGLVILHQALVLRVAQRFLLNHEDAQDAAQEVFLRLHRNLKHFQQEQEFTPWLYRMTVNICHDVRRRRKREIPLEDGMEAPAMSPDAEATVLLQQQHEMVIAALASLSERERVAIVLRDLEGLCTAEVASATGVSEATVRSQISMGRVKIRNYVKSRMRRRSV